MKIQTRNPLTFKRTIYFVVLPDYEKLMGMSHRYMDAEIQVIHSVGNGQNVHVGISPKEIYRFSDALTTNNGKCTIKELGASHGFKDVDVYYDTANSRKWFNFYVPGAKIHQIIGFVEEVIETLEAMIMTATEERHPKRDFLLLPYVLDHQEPAVVECSNWTYLPNLRDRYAPEILDNPEPPANINPGPDLF